MKEQVTKCLMIITESEISLTPAAFLDFKELIIRAISKGVVGTRKIEAGVDFPK